MKKVLMALLALVAFASCRQEANEPQGKASSKARHVRISLAGDLESTTKALVFSPETNNEGKAVLTPMFEGQTTAKAICFIYDGAGNYVREVIDLRILNGGKSFTYEANDIDVGSLSSPLYLSLYLGFDEHGNFTNSEYAPIYQANQKININTTFKSEGMPLTEETQHGVTHIYNRAVKFSLIGAIVRCKIQNDTEQDYRVKGIISNRFGNASLSVRPPQPTATPPADYRKPWLYSDATVNYTFKLVDNNGIVVGRNDVYPSEFVIYCPNVNPEDPENTNSYGSLDLDATPSDGTFNQISYSGSSLRTLNQRGTRKVTLKIQSLELPLRYLTQGFAVHGGPSAEGFASYPFTRVLEKMQSSNFFRGNPETGDVPLDPNPAILSLYWNYKHTLNGTTQAVGYLPTVQEWNTIGYQGTPEDDAYANLGADFTKQVNGYVARTGGKPFLAKDEFYREKVFDFTPSEAVMYNLMAAGELRHRPIYALRYMPADDATTWAQYRGIKEYNPMIIRNNNMRVAYRYTYEGTHLVIQSCAVGADPNINSARDVARSNLFAPTNTRVVTKILPFIGLFSTETEWYSFVTSGMASIWHYNYPTERELVDPAVPSTHSDLLRVRRVRTPARNQLLVRGDVTSHHASPRLHVIALTNGWNNTTSYQWRPGDPAIDADIFRPVYLFSSTPL